MQENLIRSLARVTRYTGLSQPYQYSIQTTNATATVIAVLDIPFNTGGIVEITIVGKNDATVGSVTAKQIVRYDKTTTTLTLGTPANILALQTDITGATFSISAVSENIQISVTGAAATVINWTVETRLINQVATNLP